MFLSCEAIPIFGNMPLPILAEALFKGPSSVPLAIPILKAAAWLVLVYVLKTYFGGARNTSERLMHSKIVMITVNSITSKDVDLANL